ncbi:VC0807 family protein [Clostridium drakei]|uniref:Intracellular septation protein A n=1 Tax=Clostridium drakei TaxID=332101 RepID=A0A2U8DQL5_9CLOT|nr:VC0807 family protein [Clostridium drakei]AWI05067.1 hypothetical protein B9W14_11350 [Clostridium drakei]
MEKSVRNNSILSKVFNRDFIVSAIIPIIIFSVFDKMGMTLKGVILSGVWSIGVVFINFINEHQINALASMAAVFSGIGLIGTIISKNPTFYFISPIAQNTLIAVVLLGSLFFERSLIQIVAEQSFLKNASKEFKERPKYKTNWKILTTSWGILNITEAVLKIILLNIVSMSSYYAISTVCGNILDSFLLIFSIFFSKWYLKKK